MKETSPYKYVLHLDWDYPWPNHWIEAWRKLKTQMLENMGFKVEDIVIKPSPSKEGGKHIWIHITSPRELNDDEINMLQWLCLDHHTRVWINILRIERGLTKWWNKLFTRHIWRKPIPKKCQKCIIRRYVNQLREEWRKCHGN